MKNSNKRYCYTFRGSSIAHQPPMTAEKMKQVIDDGCNSQYNSIKITPDDYQVYECVPVKMVVKTIEVVEFV